MIQGRLLQQVDKPAGGSALGIAAAENDASDSAVNKRPRTHRAGLLRHIEIAVGEPPVTHRFLRLCQGEHFGMGGRITKRLDLIVGAGEDGAFPDDDRPYGHFFGKVGFLRLTHCLAHKKGVAGEIDEGFVIGGRLHFLDHIRESADKVFAVRPKRIDNACE